MADEVVAVKPNGATLRRLIAAGLSKVSLDDILLSLEEYNVQIGVDALGSDPPAQVRALYDRCHDAHSLLALVKSLADNEVLTGDESAWRSWAQQQDSGTPPVTPATASVGGNLNSGTITNSGSGDVAMGDIDKSTTTNTGGGAHISGGNFNSGGGQQVFGGTAYDLRGQIERISAEGGTVIVGNVTITPQVAAQVQTAAKQPAIQASNVAAVTASFNLITLHKRMTAKMSDDMVKILCSFLSEQLNSPTFRYDNVGGSGPLMKTLSLLEKARMYNVMRTLLETVQLAEGVAGIPEGNGVLGNEAAQWLEWADREDKK